MLTGIQLEAIIAKHDRALAGAEDATIERVNAALTSAYKQLERELLKSYGRVATNTALLPNQRKLLILAEINHLLQLINTKNAHQLNADLTNLLRGSYEQGVSLADELAKAIANETLQSFAFVPLAAIRFQAQDGMKRLSKHSDEFANKTSAIVEMGLSQGWGPQKVARLMRSQLGVTKGKAEIIARTEAIASSNRAIQETLHQNDIGHVQLIATADRRVCKWCAARNGNVYELGKINLPLHPGDRCSLMPWKQAWSELGLTNDQWMREFNGKVEAELKANGQKPDNGLTYWEKQAGLTEAPEPVWQP